MIVRITWAFAFLLTLAFPLMLMVMFLRISTGRQDVPILIAAAVLSSIPAAGVLAMWKVRRNGLCAARRSKGQCEMCGYDLRATPERCPECGAVAAKGKA